MACMGIMLLAPPFLTTQQHPLTKTPRYTRERRTSPAKPEDNGRTFCPETLHTERPGRHEGTNSTRTICSTETIQVTIVAHHTGSLHAAILPQSCRRERRRLLHFSCDRSAACPAGAIPDTHKQRERKKAGNRRVITSRSLRDGCTIGLQHTGTFCCVFHLRPQRSTVRTVHSA